MSLGVADKKFEARVETNIKKRHKVNQHHESREFEEIEWELSSTDPSFDDDDDTFEPGTWVSRKENSKPRYINADIPVDIFEGNTSLMASTSNVFPLVLQKVTTALLESSSADINQFKTSHATATRRIQACNKQMAEISKSQIQEVISNSNYKCTLHFDGKTLKEILKGKCLKNERLAVLIGCDGESYLLGVPALSSSSGED